MKTNYHTFSRLVTESERVPKTLLHFRNLQTGINCQ